MASDFGFASKIFSKTVSIVKSQINSVSRWTAKMQTFANASFQKIQEKMTRYIQTITSKPKSKKDYWKIIGIYFSKQFVILAIATSGAVLIFFMNFVYPFLDGRIWYGKVYTNTSKYENFTGKAKVYDPVNKLIYQGYLIGGKADGFGTQYDISGNMIYKGNFKMNKYNGDGELYDKDGKIIYKGSFENNKFHGQGHQINSFGKTIFVGKYEVGVKCGRGIEYDPKTELKIFFGEYVNGLREGKGIEYMPDGETLIYEGIFKDGKYNGEGKKYSENHLIYSGEFKDGVYDGDGIFYDKNSGAIKYIGEFKNGFYEGKGKLFNIKNLKIMYEGEFVAGKRSGDGAAFDFLGTPIYSGKYRDDGIDYISILNKKVDEVKEILGEPNSENLIDDFLFLNYVSLGNVVIFKYNEENEHVCDKTIINPKNEFMGITVKSTASDCNNILGKTFSSFSFKIPNFYKEAFKISQINVPLNGTIEVSKYVFNKYYMRIFFTDERSETKAIEIGGT